MPNELLGRMLELLSEGLEPFVSPRMKGAYGPNWVNRKGLQHPNAQAGDPAVLLKAIQKCWPDVFYSALPLEARGYAGELYRIRNRWAHFEVISDEDTARALYTAARLLRACGAGDKATEVQRLLDDLNRKLYGPQAPDGRNGQGGVPDGELTHAEQILRAARDLSKRQATFTRNDVRPELGLDRGAWMSGYVAIFQAMRDDHPGGAPPIGKEYTGVFHRVAYATYVLTDKGRRLLDRMGA
jgi:hypothetical protein